MKEYQLTIKVHSIKPYDKIDMRAKYDSTYIAQCSQIVEDIIDKFETDKEMNLFLFELYTCIQDFVSIKKYNEGYYLNSNEIEISPNILAICLPRRIRKMYFRYDAFYERYVFKEEILNLYCYL